MENVNCLLSNFPWDLFVFLVLLGLLLWWLLNRIIRNRLKGHTEELYHRIALLESENGKLKREFEDRKIYLENELEACRKAKAQIVTSASNAVVGASAALVAGVVDRSKDTKKDDLKIVEGIGPKIEELFNNANIFSFEELAGAEVSFLKSILEAGGSRFQIHDPSTWPQQAALARDGKWDELKRLQDELNKGRRE